MKSLSDFTNVYSLSKTLRFELRPVNETGDRLEEFKNAGLRAIVEQDRQRAADYKAIKKIIDDYHRYFIEDTFNHFDISTKDFEEAFELYLLSKQQKGKKDGFEKKQGEIRKVIAELFAKNNKSWLVTGKSSKMLGGKEDSLLYKWLLKRNNNTKTDEFEKQKEYIFRFDKFTTYFKGFDDNRKNMYSPDEKSTAISFRIVNDNMVKHFGNCIRFEKIRNDFPELYEKLKQFEQTFKPTAFSQFINQAGIEEYKKIICKSSNGEGINMLINKFIQDNKLKGKDRPPRFTELFKQILSERNEDFIEVFTSDEEMLFEIKNTIESVLYKPDENGKTFFARFDELLQEYMFEDFAERIYLKKSSLSAISVRIWGGDSWSIIPNAIKEYSEKHFRTKKAKENYLKEPYSIAALQTALDEYVPTLLNKQSVDLIEHLRKANYYTKDMSVDDTGKTFKQVIGERYKKAEAILKFCDLGKGKEKESRLKVVKELLDAILDLEHYIKDIDLDQKVKDKIVNLNSDFYDTLATLHKDIRDFIYLYNKTRNYATKKPYKTDKFKLNFENPKLLGGFVDSHTDSSDNGTQHGAYLFRKKRDSGGYGYYLGVTEDKMLFRHHLSEKIHDNDKSEYERIYYYQIKPASFYNNSYPGDYTKDKNDLMDIIVSKMGNIEINTEIGKLKEKYIKQKKSDEANKVEDKVTPTQFINTIEKAKPELYQQILLDKSFICKQESVINNLKAALEKYKTKVSGIKAYIDDFPKDIRSAISKIEEISNNKSTVALAVSKQEWKEVSTRTSGNKPLYLFEIVNKDLKYLDETGKPIRHGKDNLHTMYFKGLFEEGQTVIDLGKGEIFFRDKTPSEIIQHSAGDVLKHKRYSDIWNSINSPINERIAESDLRTLSSDIQIKTQIIGDKNVKNIVFKNNIIGKIASHDIVKDRRYTQDKYMLHLSVELNYQSKTQDFASEVNKYIYADIHNNNQKNINILGIDRGERHLLYYSIIGLDGKIKIDKNGNTLQGSLNVIKNSYTSNNQEIPVETDYKSLLETKEGLRKEARENWSVIGTIKELKSGYLSHVVHQLAKLMVEHNAVIVLEDLNSGFKNSRKKVERQVYQKFEKALLEKLNYLVFKDKKLGETGHYLKAYQLTEKFESFKKLSGQTGFLFYVPAWNTSKIDPTTGFVNRFRIEKDTEDYLRRFFEKFDSIKYNQEKQYFEFEFDYMNFGDNLGGRTPWTVCSHGDKRSFYTKKNGTQTCNVNDNLNSLFLGKIDYTGGKCVKDQIVKQDKAFLSELMWQFKLLVQLRHTFEENGKELDCIISPVMDERTGRFFDSRYAQKDQPENADANGAYHIALKGLMTLGRIQEDGKIKAHKKGETNKDWLDFVEGIKGV